MTERRFSDDEVAQIFERATSGHALQATRAAEGMTLAELQSIGEEVFSRLLDTYGQQTRA